MQTIQKEEGQNFLFTSDISQDIVKSDPCIKVYIFNVSTHIPGFTRQYIVIRIGNWEVMHMKRKRWLIPFCIVSGVLLTLTALISFGIYYLFFDIQHIEGQEVLTVCESPEETYSITAYLNNGGATTSWSVLCTLKNNQTGKERNIYWNTNCCTADINWLDEKTAVINGICLDVAKDLYDSRRTNES